ncbi:MAG: hypothetical protein R2713_10295 [Ilumatobacteraceae bacterium]
MQPIDNIWNKFPRIVRDSRSPVRRTPVSKMEGKHTEVDKTLLEAIKDPLHPPHPQRHRPRARDARGAHGDQPARRGWCACRPTTRGPGDHRDRRRRRRHRRDHPPEGGTERAC